MKKLALIVLVAVVASRALTDRHDRRSVHVRHSGSSVEVTVGDDAQATGYGRTILADRPLDPPPPPRGSRLKRRPPAPPTPPARPIDLVTTSAPSGPPAWYPRSDWEEEKLARPDDAGVRVLVGSRMTTEARAVESLRKNLGHEVTEWLAADIPATWTPPARLLDRMILGTYVQTVNLNLGTKLHEPSPAKERPGADLLPGLEDTWTMYRAGQKLDFSDTCRADFVEAYRRDVAKSRMQRSGSLIAVVLALLAVTSLYVRADEATKGYYTNRLRVLATVGLGAAGVVAYRYWI